ncbi:hypothetical protein [uncultured Sphingomonas sp.]|uniref:hypothetical protein n=1 Tax=uncultured Sphingomonas sp. TaxID=158754 RepID=UPI0035CAEABD
MRVLPLFAAAALAAAPAFAQTSQHTPEHDAASAGSAPTTAAANDQIGAVAGAQQTTGADAQAQYASDLAAYDAAVRAQHRATMADEAHWRHQQRAYADAMAAWRAQVAACKAGHERACTAPSPDPAAFW